MRRALWNRKIKHVSLWENVIVLCYLIAWCVYVWTNPPYTLFPFVAIWNHNFNVIFGLVFHREELRTKYSSNAQDRKKKDYSRTQQDWTRMELGKLKDINEVNRTHMQVTCNTYLGTSAGSKAAVKSLAKVLE